MSAQTRKPQNSGGRKTSSRSPGTRPAGTRPTGSKSSGSKASAQRPNASSTHKTSQQSKGAAVAVRKPSASAKAPSNGKRKKRKKKGSAGFYFIQFLILTVLLGTFAIFAISYGPKIYSLYKEAKELVADSDRSTFMTGQSGMIYDKNGSLITILKGDKDMYYLPSDQIPQEVKDAIVSIEDKRFYKHHGVDPIGILRSAVSLVKKDEITQGGSTITQQLARNVFLTHKVSWERKVQEIFISFQLERLYSKDDILEFYINNIYFSDGYYGIQAASRGYFDQDVSELDLSQIAFLCAIPNNPTLYDPKDHMENTLGRRDRILENMKEDGKISDGQYQQAISEEITLHEKTAVATTSTSADSYITYCAVRALMETDGFEFQSEFDSEEAQQAYQDSYNTLYDQCRQDLYTKGYQIHTSIDMSLQQELQSAIDASLSEYTTLGTEGAYALQGAGVTIDNSTGYVAAIVGARSQEDMPFSLNRAYQSYRQPGSSIKPLIVYTPALEKGYTPDSTVVDRKTEDGPDNSNGKYSGSITLRYAVEQSKNTVAWNLFQEITPKVGLSYLKEMNFSKITDDDYNLAAALGGLTKGATPLEMTSGYAALENGGRYRAPTCIIRITDPAGNSIVETSPEEKQVYTEEAARTMTDILKSVMTKGLGKSARISAMDSAGKTGTTNDNKDGWFVGYTGYYTTGIWVGYDMARKLPGLYGSSYPSEIWKQFMETAHEGLDPISLP